MMNFGKVGVIYGGFSSEREISLISGKTIYNALLEAGIDVHLFDLGRNTLMLLSESKFDRVFIALHGRFGEDGTIQGVLELLGIPYTGSGQLSSGIAMNKVLSKQIWLQEYLPTPEFEYLRDINSLTIAANKLGFPLIIKPVHEGSTVGIRKVDFFESKSIEDAYYNALDFDNEVFAEKFISGRELTVSILGSRNSTKVLPVVEIIVPNGNYDYDHKYFADETKYICPAILPKHITDLIIDISIKAYNSIGCDSWARVDFILDNDNNPWLLEINTSPGMTDHSLVPIAAKVAGISYTDLCLYILSEASCKIISRIF
ncbi:D-alanine-D-alanine ligase [Candidatus Kinetoplastibacterium blastocrithidii TCC012E]|uniref:D-alanine--D-alanine ligase n=2 Tax=Candidatus Kinetoplastidibacterium blastocrithidiae TaxID=233181 RepID=M1LC12_9PROT|nr:D-alanine--D-alanine ligase B [Candidatus Kinetoplastibacterium blastocrithidii (ex Strigomonas culicis)]AGF49993.1 D-alanine-D-alanine ligase [Candidatus Kinetoplastibacterium blastocrithidii TCC012E]